MSGTAESSDKHARMNRLERALDLYLAHSQSGGADLEGLLADHEDLRELLEPMLAAGPDNDGDGVEVSGVERAALGRVLRDFRLVREIGRGGMGIVWEAEQLSLKRTVALKILPEARALSASAVARFRREAATLASLDHPGIVKAHAIDTDGETHFFAMEFVEGAPLDGVLAALAGQAAAQLDVERLHEAIAATAHRRKGSEPKLPARAPGGIGAQRTWVTAIAEIAAQIAAALAHAHRCGVVHRDVKPANILLRADGRAVLTDFGLARRSDAPALTVTGDLAGTPYYMAPEQLDGSSVDGRADVFALGVVLYEALTLRRPFDGASSRAVFERIARSEPRDPRRVNEAVPEDLASVVLKALEKEPERRYPSAGELAEDLRAFLEHRPVAARRATAWMRLRRFVRREPLKVSLVAALGVGGATVAGLSAYLINRSPEIRLGEQALRAPEVDEALVIGYAETDEGLRSSAREAFERALTLAPDCLEAIIGLALLTEREQDSQRALAWLEQHLAGHSDGLGASPPIRRVRATLLHRSGEVARARAEVENLPPLSSAADHFLAGVTNLYLGHRGSADKFALAEQHLRRAVLLSDRARKLYYFEWAHAAGHVGDAKIAADVEAALSSHWPASARGQLWLGFALRDTDSETALGAFREAVRREPDWAFAWQFLSAHLMNCNEIAEARDAAERAVKLRPDVPLLWGKLGNACLALNDAKAALVAYERMVECAPKSSIAWSGKAAALNGLGRFKEATLAAQQACELDATNYGAWRANGRAWHLLGRPRKALPLLEKAIELAPTDADTWSTLGYVHSRMRDHDAACAAFRKVLEQRPGDLAARSNVAVHLNALGNRSEALRELCEVRQRDPRFVFANRLLIMLHRDSGDEDRAIECARAWSAAAPSEPQAWLWLARAVGDRASAAPEQRREARDALERASKLLGKAKAENLTLRNEISELQDKLRAQ